MVSDGELQRARAGKVLAPLLYRLINYGGTLTDNGLTIGSYMTAPASPQDTAVTVAPLTGFSVQTSIPGQVNLVNTAGLSLTYWDGAVGPKNNSVINGGNGVWQATDGNDNWTDPCGAINASWADDSYAIFMATPGRVTVDDTTAGPVTATGMQFASDGYVVTCDPITLRDATTGNVTTIRVREANGHPRIGQPVRCGGPDAER